MAKSKACQIAASLSTLAAISTIYYGYLFTWPCLFGGLAVFAFATSIKPKNNTALALTLKSLIAKTGIAVTLFSAFLFYKNESVKNTNKTLSASTLRIINSSSKEPGIDELDLIDTNEPLGYRFKPRSSRKSLKKLINSEEPIYDVTYTIDQFGNRHTPNKKKDREQPETSHALFLGGSLTFGEGVEDDETLPYFFQKYSGISSINAGMGGYGPHQALKIVEDKNIYSRVAANKIIHLYIYRMTPNEINLAAGYAPYDKHGPCYELNPERIAIYKGSFADCKKRTELLRKTLEQYLPYLGSKEPWSEALLLRLTPSSILPATHYKSKEYKPADTERFVSIFKKINSIAGKRGAILIILAEDKFTALGKSCGKQRPYSNELISTLMDEKILVLPQSKAYSKSLCNPITPLTISIHDDNPNRAANLLTAKHLHEHLQSLQHQHQYSQNMPFTTISHEGAQPQSRN